MGNSQLKPKNFAKKSNRMSRNLWYSHLSHHHGHTYQQCVINPILSYTCENTFGLTRLSDDIKMMPSPANVNAFFGVAIFPSIIPPFFSFTPVSTITIPLFMSFSCANFLHSAPKLTCTPVHASIILIYCNSSPTHPVCTPGWVIANLIPKMMVVKFIALSNYSLMILPSLII